MSEYPKGVTCVAVHPAYSPFLLQCSSTTLRILRETNRCFVKLVSERHDLATAFQQGVRATGYVEGQNVVIELCQQATYAPQQKASLFDHLVGERKQLVRNLEAERLRGLEVDDQLEFHRLLDWQRSAICACWVSDCIQPPFLNTQP